MMEEMAKHCGMSKGHMRSISRGDVGCPSIDAIEAMSEILDMDMGMLVDAAERDGCDYSMASGHGGMDEEKDEEDESMSRSKSELKSELTDQRQRIEELQSEIEQLREEREQVASEYASALASESEVLDSETMTEKFEVAELAEMYAEQETSVTEPTEATVRSGDGGGETSALSPGQRERKHEIQEQLSELEGHDSRLAEARRDELESELSEITQ
jgi:hypothetical protein